VPLSRAQCRALSHAQLQQLLRYRHTLLRAVQASSAAALSASAQPQTKVQIAAEAEAEIEAEQIKLEPLLSHAAARRRAHACQPSSAAAPVSAVTLAPALASASAVATILTTAAAAGSSRSSSAATESNTKAASSSSSSSSANTSTAISAATSAEAAAADADHLALAQEESDNRLRNDMRRVLRGGGGGLDRWARALTAKPDTPYFWHTLKVTTHMYWSSQSPSDLLFAAAFLCDAEYSFSSIAIDGSNRPLHHAVSHRHRCPFVLLVDACNSHLTHSRCSGFGGLCLCRCAEQFGGERALA
jgi:hypothetical protein